MSAIHIAANPLNTTPAAVYTELEGLSPPPKATKKDGNLKVDYSPEALELRKTFRKLSLPSRRLVVDFAHMLAKQASV